MDRALVAVAAAGCDCVVVTAFVVDVVVALVDAVASGFAVAGVPDCAITLFVADGYDVEEI